MTPIKLDTAFFCKACGSLASTRTCPHDAADRLELSGTKVREILRSGGDLPREFTRVEVAEVLRAHYAAAAPPAPVPASVPVSEPISPVTSSATPALFPVFLKLSGRRVVVVGAGPVAASKIKSVLDTGAQVTVIAPEVVLRAGAAGPHARAPRLPSGRPRRGLAGRGRGSAGSEPRSPRRRGAARRVRERGRQPRDVQRLRRGRPARAAA